MAYNSASIVNNIEIKRINRNRIFKLLYEEGPVSKQNIADTLNLSLPTVLQNLKELEQQELILEEGLLASTGGRKAKAITYNHNCKYSVGLNITANHFSVVIINLGEEVLLRRRIRIHFEDKPDYFLRIGTFLRDAISETGIDTQKILGVGIAVPALVSKDRQTVTYAQVLNFTGGCLSKFAEHIDYPCQFVNDATAGSIAENWNVNNMENLIYLSLCNSVGGAIILNDTFYPGEKQRSAEFGHITLYPDGRPCYCGQKGCVDAYCNAKILSDTCSGNLSLFFENISHNSPIHTAVWNEYLNNLALTVNTLRMSFDCKIILGGYVGEYLEPYLPKLRELVAERNSFEHDGSYLHVCRHKHDASAVGAALEYISDFISNV